MLVGSDKVRRFLSRGTVPRRVSSDAVACRQWYSTEAFNLLRYSTQAAWARLLSVGIGGRGYSAWVNPT